MRRHKAAVNARAEAFDAVRSRGGYIDACKEAEGVWVAWGGEPGLSDGWAPVWWRELADDPTFTKDETVLEDGDGAKEGSTTESDDGAAQPFATAINSDPSSPHVPSAPLDDATARLRSRLHADAPRINAILEQGRATALVREAATLSCLPFLSQLSITAPVLGKRRADRAAQHVPRAQPKVHFAKFRFL